MTIALQNTVSFTEDERNSLATCHSFHVPKNNATQQRSYLPMCDCHARFQISLPSGGGWQHCISRPSSRKMTSGSREIALRHTPRPTVISIHLGCSARFSRCRWTMLVPGPSTPCQLFVLIVGSQLTGSEELQHDHAVSVALGVRGASAITLSCGTSRQLARSVCTLRRITQSSGGGRRQRTSIDSRIGWSKRPFPKDETREF